MRNTSGATSGDDNVGVENFDGRVVVERRQRRFVVHHCAGVGQPGKFERLTSGDFYLKPTATS